MGSATWDDTPAPAADNSWKMDSGADDGAWKPDEPAEENGFSADNISKHHDGDFKAADGGCRRCGEDGHFARDCHNICAACKGEGHSAENCEVNRMHAMFADMKIEEVSSDEAWNNVVAADKEKDVDDIRRAVFAYAKAFPELTLVGLEATFREADFNTFLIAKEQEVSDTHTIVNFQGKPDQKYVLSFQFSARPRRVKFSEGWPTTPEENIERLAEAGVVMDGFVQKCRNCEQIVESLSKKKIIDHGTDV
ncbi:unnamed protein product [Zymoseptoria tritici ST99CH_1E4]|uniref:CCHC-type domain-containing protein n=1 Tax=Zymoseptoria tritici ST99CH_1E4 TaxID=1276532 RepID=A0A2H1FK36_ZYMTR|nr:unnamed protein product [Zymoseptoria tritici ST99CH_1E4]